MSAAAQHGAKAESELHESRAAWLKEKKSYTAQLTQAKEKLKQAGHYASSSSVDDLWSAWHGVVSDGVHGMV